MTGEGLDQTKASSEQGLQNRGRGKEEGVARFSSDLIGLREHSSEEAEAEADKIPYFSGLWSF